MKLLDWPDIYPRLPRTIIGERPPVEALREVIDQMGAYDQGVRDGKLSAAEEVAALEAEVAALRHLLTAQIALAQWLDQDFGEEGADCFLAAPPVETAWHRARAGELLEERLAALAGGRHGGAGR